MPDQNDIVFEQYQIDFLGIFRAIFETVGGSGVTFSSVVDFLNSLWSTFSVVSLLLAALFLFGLIYSYIKSNYYGGIEAQGIENLEKLYQQLYAGDQVNTRWQDIEQHIQTDNPNDWKLAIIEADIMLDEMLIDAGYAGNTIGDKLKSASPSNFTTLDDAWEAHKVRNSIAHPRDDFVLSKKLAGETVTRYRRVFTEFEVI